MTEHVPLCASGHAPCDEERDPEKERCPECGHLLNRIGRCSDCVPS